MSTFTEADADAVRTAIGVTDPHTIILARHTGSRLQRLVWDITSNPALYGDLFEHPVFLIFTPTTLYVHWLTGRKKGQTDQYARTESEALTISRGLGEQILALRVAGKAHRFKFFTDQTGKLAYVQANVRALQASEWCGWLTA